MYRREERPPTTPYVSNSEQNLIISSQLFLTFRLLDLSIFYRTQTHISKPKVHDFLVYKLNFLYISMCSTILKKELTGLLIQSMSALSDRDSSGPKSVTGWASTLELCFLLSMLKLGLVSEYRTAVWEKRERAVLVT